MDEISEFESESSPFTGSRSPTILRKSTLVKSPSPLLKRNVTFQNNSTFKENSSRSLILKKFDSFMLYNDTGPVELPQARFRPHALYGEPGARVDPF